MMMMENTSIWNWTSLLSTKHYTLSCSASKQLASLICEWYQVWLEISPRPESVCFSKWSPATLITFLFSNIHKFRDKPRSISILLPWISISPIQPGNISLIEQHIQSTLTHFGCPGPYALEHGTLCALSWCVYEEPHAWNMNIKEPYLAQQTKEPPPKTTLLHIYCVVLHIILSHLQTPQYKCVRCEKGGHPCSLKGLMPITPDRQNVPTCVVVWGAVCQLFTSDNEYDWCLSD